MVMAKQMRVVRLKSEKQAADRNTKDTIFSWFYVIIKYYQLDLKSSKRLIAILIHKAAKNRRTALEIFETHPIKAGV